jgi:hypothetical protein
MGLDLLTKPPYWGWPQNWAPPVDKLHPEREVSEWDLFVLRREIQEICRKFRTQNQTGVEVHRIVEIDQ